MDESTLNQFYDLMRPFRDVVYSVKKPEMILLDLDSTLLNTYDHQQGADFHFHYQNHGYHPLVCYDGITGNLLKIELRDGTDDSSTGTMENFIKESKNGFDFASVSSASKIVNVNRLQIHALAYNIFHWFKRLKIAAKVVHSARYITFKLCSSCPYKDKFYETLYNTKCCNQSWNSNSPEL